MAFFDYFLSPRKESNPPEAKKGKEDEKPSGGVEPRPYALKHRRINFYRGRDQRQRRRRRDDPFVRTTKKYLRDRAAQTTNNRQSIARRNS